MPRYTIHFRTWNRTTRRMSGRQVLAVQARSRWSALRAWWQVQRQFQPLAEVLEVAYHAPLDPHPWWYDFSQDD